MSRAVGQKVVTIEGSEKIDHPLQKAWIELDVPQCGYCQAGQIMSAAVLLRENKNPTEHDIDAAMRGWQGSAFESNKFRKKVSRKTMKKDVKSSLMLLFVLSTLSFPVDAQKTVDTIFPKDEKITGDNFIGNAWFQQLVVGDSANSTKVGNVTFEPGTRTNWHLHPGGQILLGIAGIGYYQQKGSPKKIFRKGDVIQCPPNVPHWHGASQVQRQLHNGNCICVQA